ncbi:MAG: hypothetical protein A3I26_02430 [Candidatus Yanofskybacteria bacterium RIFCSPLOWO2_02_FULL_43_10]|nr:MAG: hypothetical protein A3I26_02430 [Candidatus Yanofskybacteria bacterium RIFCSPLOWO2_02_FULL_43_10]
MTKFVRLAAAFTVCFFVAGQSWAQTKSFETLNQNVEQGGVVLIRILPQWQGTMVCVSAFGRQYIPNKYGHVFIGVDVNTEPTDTQEMPDKYRAYLVECGRGVRLDWYYDEITVLKKDFGTPWYAGPVKMPNKAVQERRAKDVALMRVAYDKADKYDSHASGDFISPLINVEITDNFGTPRLYGQRDKKTKKIKIQQIIYHAGTDLRARTPLPVMAINSGKVLLAHYFPLSGTEGNLLVIDHGSGILSLYLHLSKFKVKAGDKVEKGQVVAFTGATPRGTPPHLHFMIKVHGTNVDPLAFIGIMNQHP